MKMEPKIIYEDEALMVLDKPAGWVVNDAATTVGVPTVQGWIAKNYDYSLARSVEHRSGIVHRIDKETSGILLVAKAKTAFEALQAQFKERKVTKTYIALVHGKLEASEGIVNASVGRLPWRRDRFGVLPGGREAQTRYQVETSLFKGEGENREYFSLLRVSPKSGRTHQIRIHLQYLHHPIVGDSFYAGRKTSRNDRLWCPRLFLHAGEIVFSHPINGQRVSFSSQLPGDLQMVLGELQKDDK